MNGQNYFSGIDSSPARPLIPNDMPVSDFRSSAGAKRGLAFDEECQVDAPYARCEDYDDPVPVPDGDADKFYKHPHRKVHVIGKAKKTWTHIRSTINSEEEERAR
jgi:hypothetical protein